MEGAMYRTLGDPSDMTYRPIEFKWQAKQAEDAAQTDRQAGVCVRARVRACVHACEALQGPGELKLKVFGSTGLFQLKIC